MRLALAPTFLFAVFGTWKMNDVIIHDCFIMTSISFLYHKINESVKYLRDLCHVIQVYFSVS